MRKHGKKKEGCYTRANRTKGRIKCDGIVGRERGRD
jgi:hypothetical protein